VPTGVRGGGGAAVTGGRAGGPGDPWSARFGEGGAEGAGRRPKSRRKPEPPPLRGNLGRPIVASVGCRIDGKTEKGIDMNVCLACGRLYDDETARCPLDAEELLPHEPTFEVGATVAEGYRVVRPIGLGQTGEIYEGREGEAGDRVVLKLLSEDLTRDRRAGDALRRHLLKARDFRHPGAASIRAVGAHGTRLLVVRDWVEGERLQDLLAADPAWPVARAIALVEQVCAVLAAAHKAALLHLQIRPSNIFVLPPDDRGFERILVVDFGIGPLRRVGNREVYGTLRTMSPEQIEGKIPTFKSDIYAAGLLLHRLIVGASAFSGSEAEVVRQVAGAAPPPLVAPSGEEIPELLDNLVRQMTEKRPTARPPAMAVVLERLRALRGSVPPSPVASVPPPAGEARPTRRERATVVLQAIGTKQGAGESAPPAAAGESDAGVRRESDTGRQAALRRGTTGRVPAVGSAALAQADAREPAAAPEPSAEAQPAGAAGREGGVPAPRPQATPEEGTTQEIQPEIIEDRPARRPPPRLRPRPDDKLPVDAAQMAAAIAEVKAKSIPPAAPAAEFGMLPAAEGEAPAESPIDISVEEPVAAGSASRDRATTSRRKPTLRMWLYVGAGVGVVLLAVVLAIAFSGGGTASSRADAPGVVVVAAAPEATEVEGTAPFRPAPEAATTAEAEAGAAEDAGPEAVEAAVAEAVGPEDDAAGGAGSAEVGGEAAGDVPAAMGEATEQTAPEEDAAGGGGDVGAPAGGETAAGLVAAGNRALGARQFGRARMLFRQALQLEPTNRAARTGLGRVAFQQGQFEEAVRYLEPLYRSQGNMDLGVAYVRVGRRDDARRQFEKLLDRNPANADARRALDALNR